MIKQTSVQQAQAIVDMCRKLNWTYSIHRSIFTIQKQFQAGSMKELVNCDSEYYSILELLPRTSSGSDWGTDCGGIGAISALNNGWFKMNRSGGSKRVLTALAKI